MMRFAACCEDGNLLPYISSRSLIEILKGNFSTYDMIRYNAKSALVPWNLMEARWRQFKDGSIGKDRFPRYLLAVETPTGNHAELTDGFTTNADAMDIDIDAASSSTKLTFSVRRGGSWVTFDDQGRIPLTPGENHLACSECSSAVVFSSPPLASATTT